jgi:site-specific DNA recombinase
LIKENSKSGMSQDDYNKKYGELMNRYERTKEKHEDLIKSRNIKKSQAINLKSFIANLKRADDKLLEWNENIWMLLVNSATVHRDTSITFRLKNGKEIIK